jgi:hypothetical protein
MVDLPIRLRGTRSEPGDGPASLHQVSLLAAPARARDKPRGAKPLGPVLVSIGDQKIDIPLRRLGVFPLRLDGIGCGKQSFGAEASAVLRRYPLRRYGNNAEIAWSAEFTDRIWACSQVDTAGDLARFTPVYTHEFAGEHAQPLANLPSGFLLRHGGDDELGVLRRRRRDQFAA